MSSTTLANQIFKIIHLIPVLTILSAGTSFSSQITDLPPISPQKCWEYPTSGLTEKGIASDNQRIYVTEVGSRVESISVDQGKKLWVSELGGEVVSNIALNKASVFVAARSAQTDDHDGHRTTLRALSKETGITNWASEVADSTDEVLGISGNRLIVISMNGSVSAIDPVKGSVIWKRALGSEIVTPAESTEESIIFGTKDKRIIVLSSSNGEETFNEKLQFLPTSVFLLDERTVAWGDERGNILVSDIATKRKAWKMKQGAAISDISRFLDKLLVTSLDNFVYAVESSTGKMRWKKRQKDRVYKPGMLSEHFIVLPSRTGLETSILEGRNGKIVNQIAIPDGRNLLQPPITTADTIIFPTTAGILSYRVNGCTAN